MTWVEMLRRWIVGPDLDAIAENIALQRRSAVWQRVRHRVNELALAEARGYVRIKAAGLVQRAVEDHLRNDPSIRPDAVGHLCQLTMEAVLRQAIIDLMHARQLRKEQVAKPLRRAA